MTAQEGIGVDINRYSGRRRSGKLRQYRGVWGELLVGTGTMKRKAIVDKKRWKTACGYQPKPKATGIALYLVPSASWISPTVTLVGIILAAYLSYHFGLNSQIQLTGMQKRQQAYSELMGEQAVIAQYLFSRFEAYVHSEFHEARWKLAAEPKDFLDLQEARRWMQKSEDLALEVAKNTKSLYETLGLIRSYFRFSPELKDLTHRIFHSPKIEVKSPPSQLDPKQLEDWKEREKKAVQETIENHHIKQIDGLANYLEREIYKEAH